MSLLAECPSCRRKVAIKRKKCPCGVDLDAAKKRGKVRYWTTYRLPDGSQKREACGFNITEAKASDAKRRTQKAEGRILDVRKDAKMTFKELAAWYLALPSVQRLSSVWRLKIAFDRFNESFGDMTIAKIKPTNIEAYQIQRLQEGTAPRTVDYETGVARTAVLKAFRDDIASGEPVKAFQRTKKCLKAGANARDRILSASEFESLVVHAPRHLKPILLLAWHTGMRRGELLNLTWDKVDLRERMICLEAGDTKTKEARTIPLCQAAVKALEAIPRRIDDEQHVFLRGGKPLRDVREGLIRACKDAGIPYGRGEKGGFTLHDLRHCFVTRARRAGVSESVVMAVVGHRSRSMFDRYNSVDLTDTRQAVDLTAGHLENVDQSVDQAEIG